MRDTELLSGGVVLPIHYVCGACACNSIEKNENDEIPGKIFQMGRPIVRHPIRFGIPAYWSLPEEAVAPETLLYRVEN